MNFQNKCVLVTGGGGFIGSDLVEHMVRAGARLTARVQYNSFNFWGGLEDIPSLGEVQVVSGDIRDSHFCPGNRCGLPSGRADPNPSLAKLS